MPSYTPLSILCMVLLASLQLYNSYLSTDPQLPHSLISTFAYRIILNPSLLSYSIRYYAVLICGTLNSLLMGLYPSYSHSRSKKSLSNLGTSFKNSGPSLYSSTLSSTSLNATSNYLPFIFHTHLLW